MSVQIKTNWSAWIAAVEAGADAASAALAEQMLADSRDYIPDDGEHMLRDIGRIEAKKTGERDLVWSSVYAGYQWYGVRADGTHAVQHYTTAGTGKAWVDEAKSANGAAWKLVAQNGFNKGMGR